MRTQLTTAALALLAACASPAPDPSPDEATGAPWATCEDEPLPALVFRRACPALDEDRSLTVHLTTSALARLQPETLSGEMVWDEPHPDPVRAAQGYRYRHTDAFDVEVEDAPGGYLVTLPDHARCYPNVISVRLLADWQCISQDEAP